MGLEKQKNAQSWLQGTSVVCSYRKMAAWMNAKTECLMFVSVIGVY